MALIKCPECGKEISDKAKNCIHCGYPIQDLKYETHGEPCAYYDTFFRSDKLIFDKGLSNGTKGKSK